MSEQEQMQDHTQAEVQEQQVSKRITRKKKKITEVDNFDLNQLPADRKEMYRQMMKSEIVVYQQNKEEEKFIRRTYVQNEKVDELEQYLKEFIVQLGIGPGKKLPRLHNILSKILVDR